MNPRHTDAGDSRPPCHRPFAYAAWALFAVSFFLPALAVQNEVYRGWLCAWMSVGCWRALFDNNAASYYIKDLSLLHLMVLTLANLFMLASPFFLLRRVCRKRTIKLLLVGAFVSLALTSAFLLEMIGGLKDIKIGYFVWVMSFALLGASIMRGRIDLKGAR